MRTLLNLHRTGRRTRRTGEKRDDSAEQKVLNSSAREQCSAVLAEHQRAAGLRPIASAARGQYIVIHIRNSSGTPTSPGPTFCRSSHVKVCECFFNSRTW